MNSEDRFMNALSKQVKEGLTMRLQQLDRDGFCIFKDQCHFLYNGAPFSATLREVFTALKLMEVCKQK